MTDGIAKTARFNPARANAKRISIDPSRASSSGSGGGSGAMTWGLGLLLVAGALGGAYWAHNEGHIEIPGLNDVLAKYDLGGAVASERLLAPGAEPQAELRYTWADGASQACVVTVEATTRATLAGEAQPVADQPALRANVRAVLGNATAEGDRFWTFELDQLALVPATGSATPPTAELQAALAEAAGSFKGTVVLSPRGAITKGDLSFPGAPPELSHLLDQLAQTLALALPALPNEPVGAGARWRTNFELAGGDASLDADHELVEIDAARTRIQTSISNGSRSPAVFRAPGLEDSGAPAAFRATGNLTRTLDLGGLVTSLEGETTVEAQLARTNEAGEAQDLEVVTTYRTTLAAQ